MRRRVVITGMGAVTPLGHSVRDTFAALVAGRNGIGPITHFRAETFPTTFAAEVKDFHLERLRAPLRTLGKCRSEQHLCRRRRPGGAGRCRRPGRSG